jgi:hypothetical protein
MEHLMHARGRHDGRQDHAHGGEDPDDRQILLELSPVDAQCGLEKPRGVKKTEKINSLERCNPRRTWTK